MKYPQKTSGHMQRFCVIFSKYFTYCFLSMTVSYFFNELKRSWNMSRRYELTGFSLSVFCVSLSLLFPRDFPGFLDVFMCISPCFSMLYLNILCQFEKLRKACRLNNEQYLEILHCGWWTVHTFSVRKHAESSCALYNQ